MSVAIGRGLFAAFSIPAGASLSTLSGVVAASSLGANGGGVLGVSPSLLVGVPHAQDSDGDGTPDNCDLCPNMVDAVQVDSDFDGIGDGCDVCPFDADNDFDGDSLCADVDPDPFNAPPPPTCGLGPELVAVFALLLTARRCRWRG